MGGWAWVWVWACVAGLGAGVGLGVVKLAEEEDCKEDIRTICKDEARSNFAVLECLQNERRDLQDVVSNKCNHLLWNYKMNLTRSGRIEELAKGVCEEELKENEDCRPGTEPGHTISCMTEKLNEIKNERCRQYLLRLAAIVFSDYRYVKNMVDNCQEEIQKFKCGRVEGTGANRRGQGSTGEDDEAPPPRYVHSQGATIECLSVHANQLGEACHKQILRLAELQSDDFHLDRPLFFSCRDDREKFCGKVRSGEGRVYKCLIKHKTDRGMSKECAEQLSRRQKLTVQDYRANRGIVRACRSAIQENSCRKGSSNDVHDVKLSKILLCLENALRKGASIDGSCRDEMLAHRRQLMEDYKLSPDLMVACQKELDQLCHGGMVSEGGGRTLHCLMKHARSHKMGRKRVTDECKRELEKVVKETDAGEDWRVDPVLHEACHGVVDSSCKDVMGGNARVMRCLMRHLETPEMTSECERALLEIQYFVSRDWKLDPQLHKACVDDATRLCHAKKDWAENSVDGVQVLPCSLQICVPPHRGAQCAGQEVQRVMHERAAYVDLHPDIEMACMEHLAQLCSQNTGPKEEMTCLQDNLEKLGRECKEVVSNYTEAEAKDVRLNADVMTPLLCPCCWGGESCVCAQRVAQHRGGEGDSTLMDCLIRHKNSEAMQGQLKCRIVIEHFQLLSMKDYIFSPKFREACQADVASLCSRNKPRNKADVIECLSGHVRNAVLRDITHKVSRPCRQQLRQQLLQRHEDIRLDPVLQNGCSRDIAKFCKGVAFGKGGGESCVCVCVCRCVYLVFLPSLHPFYSSIFLHALSSITPSPHPSPFTPHSLTPLPPLTTPSPVSHHFLNSLLLYHNYTAPSLIPPHHPSPLTPHPHPQVLECLRTHKANISIQCHRRLFVREQEELQDPGTDVVLMAACRQMVDRYCHDVNSEKLLQCLKSNKDALNFESGCRTVVMRRLVEQTTDTRLNPDLLRACRHDMAKFCSGLFERANASSVELNGLLTECLKEQLPTRKLSTSCRSRVVSLARTAALNYRMDPILVERCRADMNILCQDEADNHMEECLKLAFQQQKLRSEMCRLHLAHIIETQRADLSADPFLNQVCGVDDNKFCTGMESGTHFSCLLDVLERNPQGLNTECREALRKRQEMYSAAIKMTNIGSMSDLVRHVNASTERTYLLMVLFVLVGAIFIGGLFCGRVTKRTKFLKDR
ncbi:LOW QUALITY PROTEIN: Golgi apparatus protein 1-like [Scylla paramamosain]|uniref:LOW QUALITY PROTEIN: Golgi apparatus protein 1-like n=1 Tax=Scylla paramamosain TaxID=85552 RepID=UPI00308392D6